MTKTKLDKLESSKSRSPRVQGSIVGYSSLGGKFTGDGLGLGLFEQKLLCALSNFSEIFPYGSLDTSNQAQSSTSLSVALASSKQFADVMRKRLEKEPALDGEYSLDQALVEDIERKFLGTTFEDVGAALAQASPGYPSEYRSVLYWLEHGRLTSDLMRQFAKSHGLNAKLYGQLGRIHDVDFLSFPHISPDQRKLSHPLPLALYLVSNGAPSMVVVAIMEHAGYVGRGKHFASQLSAALSACDDLATYMAVCDAPLGLEHHLNKLSPAALSLASAVPPPRLTIRMDKSCPARVLTDPDTFINQALSKASAWR